MTYPDRHEEIARTFDDALTAAVEEHAATHPTPAVPNPEDALIAVDHEYLDQIEPDGEG